MPRPSKPDCGAVPCPKCRKVVPMRKDARGNFYEVCGDCNSDKNSYYLENGYMFSPGETFDSVMASGRFSNQESQPGRSQVFEPGRVPADIEHIIVPARPTPKKVLAAASGNAGPEPKPGPEVVEPEPKPAPVQISEPVKAEEPGQAEPVKKKSLLSHIAGEGDKSFNDWFENAEASA